MPRAPQVDVHARLLAEQTREEASIADLKRIDDFRRLYGPIFLHGAKVMHSNG